MKRLFLLLLLIVTTVVLYGQRPKSITFSDSTVVKDNFGSPVPIYGMYNIVNLGNNNGFNISNFYDDGSYEPKYLFMRKKFDGNSLSDTVYHFNPLNIQGFSYNIKATSKIGTNTIIISGIEDANFVPNAFIYTVDISGNILWNKYTLIDSSNTEVKGAFADEANNNFLYFGISNDYMNSPPSYESFINKVDGSGNLIWSNKYGYLGSDTNELSINTGSLANDGGYIFAGNSISPNKTFFRIFKTDTSGNIIWDNPFNIINQIGNDTIFPGDFKNVLKVLSLKDGNAILVASRSNSQTETEQLVLINFNQTTGSINYSKLYSLPSIESIYVTSVEIDMNDNIILSYEDLNINANWLVKIDKSGTFISSHRIYDTPTNTEWQKGFSLVDDGGFIVINSKIDNFFNPNGFFIFKTNKDLILSCADFATGTSFITENINTFSESIQDTVYTPSIYEGSLSYAGNTSAIFEKDLYCNCQISISGTVADINSTPAANTPLYLYKVKPLGQFELFDSTMTDAVGNYMFDYLPEEQFIIKSSTNLPNTVSTYYGSPNDHVNWDSAWVFNLSCSNPNLTGKDITLVPTVPQSGNGVLSGFVYDLGSFGTLRKSNPNDKALGDPIPGIDITVNQSPGGTVGISTTDGNGGYNFTGLNVGANFVIEADIPGLPNDSIYTVVVTVTNNNFDSLNFYIDSAGVYILDTNLTTSVTVYNDLETAIELMPNPTQNNVNLVIQSEISSNAAIRLTSYTGSIVSEKRQQINKGKNTIELTTDQLSSGIYFIQIQMNKKIIVKKLVKQ